MARTQTFHLFFVGFWRPPLSLPLREEQRWCHFLCGRCPRRRRERGQGVSLTLPLGWLVLVRSWKRGAKGVDGGGGGGQSEDNVNLADARSRRAVAPTRLVYSYCLTASLLWSVLL